MEFYNAKFSKKWRADAVARALNQDGYNVKVVKRGLMWRVVEKKR